MSFIRSLLRTLFFISHYIVFEEISFDIVMKKLVPLLINCFQLYGPCEVGSKLGFYVHIIVRKLRAKFITPLYISSMPVHNSYFWYKYMSLFLFFFTFNLFCYYIVCVLIYCLKSFVTFK